MSKGWLPVPVPMPELSEIGLELLGHHTYLPMTYLPTCLPAYSPMPELAEIGLELLGHMVSASLLVAHAHMLGNDCQLDLHTTGTEPGERAKRRVGERREVQPSS